MSRFRSKSEDPQLLVIRPWHFSCFYPQVTVSFYE